MFTIEICLNMMYGMKKKTRVKFKLIKIYYTFYFIICLLHWLHPKTITSLNTYTTKLFFQFNHYISLWNMLSSQESFNKINDEVFEKILQYDCTYLNVSILLWCMYYITKRNTNKIVSLTWLTSKIDYLINCVVYPAP